MTKLRKAFAACLVVLGIAGTGAAVSSTAQASAPFSCSSSTTGGSCGPYVYQPQITSAGGTNTYVNNNVWSAPAGFTGQVCQTGSATPCQTTSANNPGDWETVANFSNNQGNILSYPDSQQLYSEQPVLGFSSLTSSFTENMNANANTTAEAAYDLWYNNWGQEVMIWVDDTPSERNALNYDTLKASNASISGQSWNVYCNGTCPGGEVIVSLNSNEQTGSVDIKAITQYLVNNGIIAANPTLTAIDFGPEISSTGGAFEPFDVTCFTISENVPNQPCSGGSQAQAPVVTTSPAGNITTNSADLNGTVNPEGQATTYQFDFGTTTSYGTVVPTSAVSAGSGTTAVSESANVSGLQPNTLYHYRINATNATGTSHGSDQTFTTNAVGQAPAVVTQAASGVTSGAADLNGTVNPNGQATTYKFDLGTTSSYGTSIPSTPASAGSGTTAVSESQNVTGLQPSTLYHYRIEATNSSGTTYGSDQTFTTSAASQTTLENKTFENGTTESFSNWYSAGVANSTVAAHSGTHSLKITSSASTWGVADAWPGQAHVTPGKTDTFSGWFKRTSGSDNSLLVTAQYLDSAGNQVGNETDIAASDNSTGWTKFSGQAVVPAGAVTAHIYIIGSNGGTHYLDDLLVTEA